MTDDDAGWAFLIDTEHPEQRDAVRYALTGAGVAYRIRPVVTGGAAFFVPLDRHDAARRAVEDVVDDGRPLPGEGASEGAGAAGARRASRAPARFPAGAVQAAAGLALAHLLVVLWAASPWNPGIDVAGRFGLSRETALAEPWRFLTYLAVHADARHAFWNGVSLVVFAVPLIEWLGRPRALLVYLAAGAGGGWVGLQLLDPGVRLVGCSGAVAGLFGAWILLTLRRARVERLWRGRMRTWGIAALYLPSLLQPQTADGRPISVGAHVGGLVTGMAIGALLARLVWRVEPAAGGVSPADPTGPADR